MQPRTIGIVGGTGFVGRALGEQLTGRGKALRVITRRLTNASSLLIYPEVDVRVKGATLRLRARLASPAEKASVWPICVEHYPEYASYQTRTNRDIPVFICEPR